MFADDKDGSLPPKNPREQSYNSATFAFTSPSPGWDIRPPIRPYLQDFRAWGCAVHNNTPIDDPGNIRAANYCSFSYFPGRTQYPHFGKSAVEMPMNMNRVSGDTDTFVIMQDRNYWDTLGFFVSTHGRGFSVTRGIAQNPSNTSILHYDPRNTNMNLVYYDGHLERLTYAQTDDVGLSSSAVNSNERSRLPRW
jgi:hypothetical protein